MSSIDERLMSNLAQFNEHAEQIRNLRQETAVAGVEIPVPEETKRAALRDLFEHHAAIYEQLKAAKLQEVADNVAQARQNLFRYRSGLGIDLISINMSVRDAEERLAGVSNPSELAERLETAAEYGDQIMAKCILKRAVGLGEDFGGGPLVHRFLELYPGEAQNYAALQDASTEANRIEMLGVGGSITNPEDAAQSFSGIGGGIIPDHYTGQSEG